MPTISHEVLEAPFDWHWWACSDGWIAEIENIKVTIIVDFPWNLASTDEG
jgi:hypothetical protein